MMHGDGTSDAAIVAGKPANEAVQAAEEQVERRAATKGNADQQSTCRTLCRTGVTQALDRIRRTARERKKERFTALLHHISPELLEAAFYALKEHAAAGLDGLSWQDYEQHLEGNLADLHARVHRGAYRPLPARRVYIPKSDGGQRPLAVAALEDKIVQRATAAVLNAIYEEDFLGFSYGFRPRRSAHDAMNALMVGIARRRVNFIVDADIRSFFDTVSQQWLIRFVEHRIGDQRIIRLIRKWLRAGVLEDGIVRVSDSGTGGADQQSGAQRLPLLRHRALEAGAPAPQPDRRHDVEDLHAPRQRLAPKAAHPLSIATSKLRRHAPEVGAVCGKAARTDLCGGRSAMSVPTATVACAPRNDGTVSASAAKILWGVDSGRGQARPD
jgi:retron-type reverse transcriptase